MDIYKNILDGEIKYVAFSIGLDALSPRLINTAYTLCLNTAYTLCLNPCTRTVSSTDLSKHKSFCPLAATSTPCRYPLFFPRPAKALISALLISNPNSRLGSLGLGALDIQVLLQPLSAKPRLLQGEQCPLFALATTGARLLRHTFFR